MSERRARDASLIIPAGNLATIGPNADRVALIFSSHLSLSYNVSFGESAVVGAGLRITPGFDPVEITKELIGGSVTDFVSIFQAAGTQIGIIEVTEYGNAAS